MADLAAAGVDFDDVTARSSAKASTRSPQSFHDALDTLEKRRAEHLTA